MKYRIETKVTRTYDVLFDAPDKSTACIVEERLDSYLRDLRATGSSGTDYPTPFLFPHSINETRLCTHKGVENVIIKEGKSSYSTLEPESMEPDDIAIMGEVEWWNGNLNSFEIYDKLKDEFSKSDQRKLINYAKKYFHNCKDLQYQLQDMADTLGVDLEEDEDDS